MSVYRLTTGGLRASVPRRAGSVPGKSAGRRRTAAATAAVRPRAMRTLARYVHKHAGEHAVIYGSGIVVVCKRNAAKCGGASVSYMRKQFKPTK